jgi:hypothetical protein
MLGARVISKDREPPSLHSPDRSSMRGWIGGTFDPAAFDLADTNERFTSIKL